jgi:phosphatidylglycerol:prolipoprotein diacylglycerol transferase
MHPIFHVHGRELGAYTVLLLTALAISAAVSIVLAPRLSLTRRQAAWLAFAAAVIGLAGAKLGSVELEGAAALSSHGFTYLGGLAAGGGALLAVAKALRLRVGVALDLGAVGAAVGLAIGRIGCLLAGCCWGKPTLFPLALVFRDFRSPVRPIGVPLHATQVYESLGAFVLFGGLVLWSMRRRPAPGAITVAFIIAYGALRFGLEFLRADPRGAYLGGLSPPQVECLSMITIAGVIAFLRARAARCQPA